PPLPLASSPPFHGGGDLRRLDLKRGCSTFLRVAGISGSLRRGRARPPAAAAGRMGTPSATSSASASQGQGTAARTAVAAVRQRAAGRQEQPQPRGHDEQDCRRRVGAVPRGPRRVGCRDDVAREGVSDYLTPTAGLHIRSTSPYASVSSLGCRVLAVRQHTTARHGVVEAELTQVETIWWQ
uniref:Uncharacterized protein n=1 Tax=Aegilops tauschii subsp. strangulata TaxID=200361 RepID=A0A453NJ17_AEGTS